MSDSPSPIVSAPAAVSNRTVALPNPLHRNWIWRGCQWVLQIFFVFWVRYRARGIEQLPSKGGALLLINHQSFLDPLFAGLPLSRPVSYLARDNLFRVPLIGWFLRQTYVMPINREATGTASLRESLRRMEHGFYVGIFPEGTRSPGPMLGPLKPGFIALVKRLQVPIHPVGIAGSSTVLPRKSLWIHASPVRVVFGPALSTEIVAELCAKGRESELVAFAQSQLQTCVDEAQAWLKEEPVETPVS